MSKKVSAAKSQSSSVRGSSSDHLAGKRESAKSIKLRSQYNGSFINALGSIDNFKVEGKKQQQTGGGKKGLINIPSNEDLQTLCGWESKKSSNQSRKQTVYVMNPPGSNNVTRINAENHRYPLRFGNQNEETINQSICDNIRHGEVLVAEDPIKKSTNDMPKELVLSFGDTDVRIETELLD